MLLLKIFLAVLFALVSPTVVASAVVPPLRLISVPSRAHGVFLPATTNITSIAEARKLGARYPPGYSPMHPYIHHVRGSSITLRCTRFTYEPLQDITKIHNVLMRLLQYFHDTRGWDEPVFNGPGRGWEWYEPTPDAGEPFAGLEVVVPDDHPKALKGGDLFYALLGVNEIRLAYPKLDMRCDIFRNAEGAGVPLRLGWIYLFFEPR
ncbi:hypothetical protein XPA_005730 [Xanthoria parietina]